MSATPEGLAVWDNRWRGRHGIARFATEVSRRLSPRLISLPTSNIRPASVLDPGFIHRSMMGQQVPLFVSPGFNAGIRGKYEQVITIHDLIHLKVGAERTVAKSLYYSAVIAPVVRGARRVLTVSEFSKSEIVEHFRLDPEKVVVVGNGSSMEVLSHPASPDGANQFVLFVGNKKPHKNLDLLVRAATHVDEAVNFVLIGIPQAEVSRLCDLHRADVRRFTVLSSLTDDQMQGLYTGAGCVALPSTYEGFGLVAVEAMSRATPTVYCSEAVDEVVGSTGFLVPDPADAAEYARALEKAMGKKRELFHSLTGRAATFSWDDVAARVSSSIWAE